MMNSCVFKNFKIEPNSLKFDVIVNFSGLVPKTGKYAEYKDTIIPFYATFSEPLEYDNIDVIQMIEIYIKQANLPKKFEKIYIELEKKGTPYNPNKGKNFLFFNSHGFDSYAIYLTFRDELKERMIEFTWVKEKIFNRVSKAIKSYPHYREPVVIYFKNQLETMDLLWNPCNATYLKILLYKKFNIGLTLYGDVSFSYFQPEKIRELNQLNFGFHQTELISLYISMILGSREIFNNILFENEQNKIIRKLAYTKILLDYFGIKFENYIDMVAFNRIKKIIQKKKFSYYFSQEFSHRSMIATNFYFFKDAFIAALQELFYDTEKDIIEERFKEFLKNNKCGHPLYNGNYFKISFQGFKKYMVNLPESFKWLETVIYNKYKLLNLFDDNEIKNG